MSKSLSFNYKPNKKLKIEIVNNDMSGCRGYDIYHILNKVEKRKVTGFYGAGDDQIEEILSSADLEKFTNAGKFVFMVTADALNQQFQYLY